MNQRDRRAQQRIERNVAKAEHLRQTAPARIRKAARACEIWGILAIIGGVLPGSLDAPKFGGDAYTEIVAQLADVRGAISWIAAMILFVVAALLKALADILSEQRRQTMWMIDNAPPPGPPPI